MLRTVRTDDASAICEIYNHYIQHSPATFEEVELLPDEMERRIIQIAKAYPWMVDEVDGKLTGYCYARPWHERAAYRYSIEAGIYLDQNLRGKGIGSELLAALLAELRARKFHCVMGGVSLPNPASAALLEKFGFQQVAHFREVGYKFNRWIDVGYWQLIF